MNRIEAVRALRKGTLSTDVFNAHTPYPFRVNVRSVGGAVFSHLSCHPAESKVRLAPRQILSFIKRNYPA